MSEKMYKIELNADDMSFLAGAVSAGAELVSQEKNSSLPVMFLHAGMQIQRQLKQQGLDLLEYSTKRAEEEKRRRDAHRG